jgi:hypothetical protein
LPDMEAPQVAWGMTLKQSRMIVVLDSEDEEGEIVMCEKQCNPFVFTAVGITEKDSNIDLLEEPIVENCSDPAKSEYQINLETKMVPPTPHPDKGGPDALTYWKVNTAFS